MSQVLDLKFQSQIRALHEILNSLAPDIHEKERLLSGLTAKNTVLALILSLFSRYLTFFDEKTGAILVIDSEADPEKEQDLAELTVIFHKYAEKNLFSLSSLQVITLLYTGKTTGMINLSVNPNFLPAGFWQLPLVLELLKEVIIENMFSSLKDVCEGIFVLPDDWDDKKYPTDQYISVEAQIERLAPSISAALLLRCIPDVEVEV
jgi:hypothetical protein